MRKSFYVAMVMVMVLVFPSASNAAEKKQIVILETPSGNQHVILELVSDVLSPEKGEGFVTLLSYELMNRGWKVVFGHSAGSLINPRRLIVEHSGEDGGWFYLKEKTSEKAHSHHSLRDLKRRGLTIIHVLANDIEQLTAPTPTTPTTQAMMA